MSVFLLISMVFSASSIRLTPSRVESLLVNVPEQRASMYDYAITKNELAGSISSLFLSPGLSYSKTKINDQNPLYSEGLSLSLSILSPSKLSSVSEHYFAMKEGYVSYNISVHNAFLKAIELLFDYEYTRQKLIYDSLNVEYARKMLSLSEERLREGISDSLDVLKALDNVESVKLTFIKDSSNLCTLKKNIEDYLGFSGDFVVVIDSFIPPDINGIDPKKSENISLSREMKKSALVSTYLSLLSLLPDVGIEYAWNYSGNTFERNLGNFDDTRTLRVYFTLDPLRFLFNLRGSILRYKRSVWNMNSTIIKERQRFRDNIDNLNFLKHELEVLKMRNNIKERSFALSLEKYSQGTLSFQDILKEQADYMSTISEYLKVKLDIIKLQYNLWYNFGGER